jgi:FAD/FMN-containing dehydrogenase
MGVVTLPPELVSTLVDAVGPTQVLTGEGETAGWAVDWTGRFVGRTPAVVRPGSADEVAAVVRACAAEGVALVPQGGNTGLVGGSVPLEGEVVLSLRRLDAVGEVDHAASQVTAGAGVTIAGLDERARAAGLAYGVDFAARDSATVGGSIATNAGGVHFCRHGGTRQQLLGVEAVLGDGSIISHLGGLEKDNTGYDLAGLLCGSEGTLGVVTAARLRLVPRADEPVVALLAFDGADAVVLAMDAVRRLRRALGAVDAAELFLHDGLALVVDTFGLPAPFTTPHAAYVLVERAEPDDPTAALAAAVDGLDGLADVAVATEAPRRADLWRYREAHTEAINAVGVPHKLDVTLPAGALAGFVAEVGPSVAAVAAGARTYLFGHAADGNVHVNVVGPPIDDDRVDDAVLSLVIELGGSISAEHGIGTAKKAWLHRSRSRAELAAMRALKRALDPAGILNPNVLLPPP